MPNHNWNTLELHIVKPGMMGWEWTGLVCHSATPRLRQNSQWHICSAPKWTARLRWTYQVWFQTAKEWIFHNPPFLWKTWSKILSQLRTPMAILVGSCCSSGGFPGPQKPWSLDVSGIYTPSNGMMMTQIFAEQWKQNPEISFHGILVGLEWDSSIGLWHHPQYIKGRISSTNSLIINQQRYLAAAAPTTQEMV